MKINQPWLKLITKLGLLLMIGISMNTEAGLFGISGASWKEEVLLHDGQKIVVERSITRGGHGIAHQELITDESLTFTMPGTGRNVIWEDKFSEDVGGANFNLILLEVLNGTAYLLGSPMGCLSYNKWGRPNPPYVIFQYQGNEWKRIALQELPAEFKMPNLIISSPDDRAAKAASNGLVSAEKIKELNAGFKQSEFKTIMREASPSRESVLGCVELILYKGKWIMPNDPVARAILDRKTK